MENIKRFISHIAIFYYKTKKTIWETPLRLIYKIKDINKNKFQFVSGQTSEDSDERKISEALASCNNSNKIFTITSIIRSIFNDLYGLGCILVFTCSLILIFSPELQMILHLENFVSQILSHNALAILGFVSIATFSFIQGFCHLIRGLAIQKSAIEILTSKKQFTEKLFSSFCVDFTKEVYSTRNPSFKDWEYENDRAFDKYCFERDWTDMEYMNRECREKHSTIDTNDTKSDRSE